MTRKNFYEILKIGQIDLKEEYKRLYELFVCECDNKSNTLEKLCMQYFRDMPFIGTCIDYKDFQRTYHLVYLDNPYNFDINYFLLFCELTYSFFKNLNWHIIDKQIYLDGLYYYEKIHNIRDYYSQQIKKVIDKINYVFYQKENGIYILIPKDQAVNSVAEIIEDDDLSYRVIEYNHHSMKGDIEQKKSILLKLAHKLEPLDDKLKNTNEALKSNLFFMFNNLDLRHNNTTRNLEKEENRDTNYKQIVVDMAPDELENWYDETYQLCLLAFLELDNIERMQKIEELKKKIKN